MRFVGAALLAMACTVSPSNYDFTGDYVAEEDASLHVRFLANGTFIETLGSRQVVGRWTAMRVDHPPAWWIGHDQLELTGLIRQPAAPQTNERRSARLFRSPGGIVLRVGHPAELSLQRTASRP